TWAVEGDAAVTDWHTRGVWEISSWPGRWDVSGSDVWVEIEAARILRRLGQGQKALESTLRRRLPTFAPVAYWPMEDAGDATQAASPIEGVQPMRAEDVSRGSRWTRCPARRRCQRCARALCCAASSPRRTVPSRPGRASSSCPS